MKICCDCAVNKEFGEFYKTGNGSPACVCKECHKLRMRTRSRTNPAVQEYDRRRAKTPDRKEKLAINASRWRRENPIAYHAHITLNNAVRDKKVIKTPCCICGTTENVHGHHKDYGKPLDVNWLCAKCHQRIHSAFPELGGHYDNDNLKAEIVAA